MTPITPRYESQDTPQGVEQESPALDSEPTFHPPPKAAGELPPLGHGMGRGAQALPPMGIPIAKERKAVPDLDNLPSPPSDALGPPAYDEVVPNKEKHKKEQFEESTA